LDFICVGGARCTSVEALQRFYEQLTLAAKAGDVGSSIEAEDEWT
jgi:hypothetical protein